MKLKILYICLILYTLYYPLRADIDDKIKAIQNAPVHERFKLMNAFKREMATMQESERINAMGEIQSITKSKYVDRALREIRSHKRDHTRNSRASTRARDEAIIHTEEKIENEVEDNVEEETEDQIENEVEDNVEEETEEDHDD